MLAFLLTPGVTTVRLAGGPATKGGLLIRLRTNDWPCPGCLSPAAASPPLAPGVSRLRSGLMGGSGGGTYPALLPDRDRDPAPIRPFMSGDEALCGRLTVGTRLVLVRNVGSEISNLRTVFFSDSFSVPVVFDPVCSDGRRPLGRTPDRGEAGSPALSGEMGDACPDRLSSPA